MARMLPTSMDAYKLLHNGILALSRIESNGMVVDVDYCKRTQTEVRDRMTAIRKKLDNYKEIRRWKNIYGSKFNLTSNTQLSSFLFRHMGMEPKKMTAGGDASTDYESLAALDLDWVNDILSYRKLHKVQSTYLDNIIRESVDGIMRPNFHLHTVKTYRSSSSNINFQNIPIRDPDVSELIRTAFKARPGRILLEVDFSKLEVCIATCYHKDPTMIKYIMDKSSCMHRDMAIQCFKLEKVKMDWKLKPHKDIRYCGKNQFVFPEFYGDYYANCAQNLWNNISKMALSVNGIPLKEHLKSVGISTYTIFENHIKRVEDHFWNERFPVYKQWKDEWVDEYHDKGYFITKTGFKCGGYMGRNDVINYPVQGAAFHCLLWSLIELEQELRTRKMKSLIIGQIHDSIVMDVVPEELDMVVALLKDIMTVRLLEAWKWIIVPLEIEIETTPVDGNWFQKKELKLAA